MFTVTIYKVSRSVGFSGVTGEESIGTSYSEETLQYNNIEAAQAAKKHIEENYGHEVSIEESSESGGWTEFKPEVYDYYQRRNYEQRQKRQNRNYRRYGRKY